MLNQKQQKNLIEENNKEYISEELTEHNSHDDRIREWAWRKKKVWREFNFCIIQYCPALESQGIIYIST